MFYSKNVPNWERALRILIGLLGAGFAFMSLGDSHAGVGLGIMGASLAVSGLFGFCPMCAMVGRKLDRKS